MGSNRGYHRNTGASWDLEHLYLGQCVDTSDGRGMRFRVTCTRVVDAGLKVTSYGGAEATMSTEEKILVVIQGMMLLLKISVAQYFFSKTPSTTCRTATLSVRMSVLLH